MKYGYVNAVAALSAILGQGFAHADGDQSTSSGSSVPPTPPASGSPNPSKAKDVDGTAIPLVVSRELDGQIRILELKLKEAQNAFASAKAMVDAGLGSSSQLGPLEVKLAEAKAKLAKAKQDQLIAVRMLALSAPIDIQLSNARIRDAAVLLSRLSNMSISVDRNVPQNLTVTTTAQGVPLGTALEYIAGTARLTISASKDGGLAFALPGKVTVNGKIVDYKGAAWPWSDDMNQTYELNFGPLGERWKRLADLDQMLELDNRPKVGYPVTIPQMPAYAPFYGLSTPTVTALGNTMLVVVEPGTGPKGESGLWMTLYSVKNGQFHRSSRYFHKSVGQLSLGVGRTHGLELVPKTSKTKKTVKTGTPVK